MAFAAFRVRKMHGQAPTVPHPGEGDFTSHRKQVGCQHSHTDGSGSVAQKLDSGRVSHLFDDLLCNRGVLLVFERLV